MVKSQTLDRTFAALSDPTRRAMLERLSAGPATISELAKPAGISLPGVLKHVRILEGAELVTSEKKGRSRQCRLGPAQLDDATAWIDWYRNRWNSRLIVSRRTSTSAKEARDDVRPDARAADRRTT
jgi:DNA-binding transcriptional ArsR family regulator